jgi:Na+-driven multidrug efflux pump
VSSNVSAINWEGCHVNCYSSHNIAGLAARTDPVHAAAHQLAFQLWLSSSLLADSLAVAVQSMLARFLVSSEHRAQANAVVVRTQMLSLQLGVALAIGLGLSGSALPHIFTTSPAVVAAVRIFSCTFALMSAWVHVGFCFLP